MSIRTNQWRDKVTGTIGSKREIQNLPAHKFKAVDWQGTEGREGRRGSPGYCSVVADRIFAADKPECPKHHIYVENDLEWSGDLLMRTWSVVQKLPDLAEYKAELTKILEDMPSEKIEKLYSATKQRSMNMRANSLTDKKQNGVTLTPQQIATQTVLRNFETWVDAMHTHGEELIAQINDPLNDTVAKVDLIDLENGWPS